MDKGQSNLSKNTQNQQKSERHSKNESSKKIAEVKTSTSVGEKLLDSNTTSRVREKSPDESTAPKIPRLEPGILKPGTSRSSISSEISPPHGQWSFNALLIQISKKINADDFKQMKDMYKGGGIPRRTLSDLKTPMDLFDVMRHEAFLSPVDLLQLEGLLWSIKRHDLLDIVIDYATQSKNVIYLQPASRTPVNGYKHVKFHVRGKKFGEMKTGDIRYLRTVAAITVLIPPSFVLIDGIDPSKSVVVTLQFPEQHANILKNILETREVEVAELIEFGVDSITIGETTFQITGQQEEHSDIFSEQDVDISIPWLWERRHKVQNLQKENEKHLNRIAELQQQMFCLQAENETFRTVCGTKNKILSEEKSKESIPVAVGVLDALNRFVSILEELTKENCKKNSILRVLQAHAILIASFCYQDVSILFQNILIQAKQMLNLMVMATVQSALQHFIGVNNAEAPIKALNEISEKITTDESKQLEKAYKLTEYEKEEVKTGSRSLLLVLLKKQSEENEDVPVREFLEKCLKIINRQDLLQEFFAKFEKYAKEDIEKAGKNRTGTEDMEAEANPPSEPKINDIAKNVRLILVKLSEIGQKLNHLPEFGKLDTELKKYPHCLYNKFLESSKFPL